MPNLREDHRRGPGVGSVVGVFVFHPEIPAVVPLAGLEFGGPYAVSSPPTDVASLMRILHLIDSLGIGGAERRLLNDVVRLNHDCCHTVAHLFSDTSMADLFLKNGIPVIGLGLRGLLDVHAMPRLRHLIRQIRPDVVHTQLFGADCYGRLVARAMGIPVMSTIQGSAYESPDPYLRSRKREWIDRLTARTCVAHFVAVSDFVKRSMVRRFRIPEQRVSVIPNAIDPQRFETVGSERVRRLKEELCLPEGSKILITIGRLDPPKGHRFVLQALTLLQGSLSKLSWLVVGDGCRRQQLIRRTEALGLQRHVRFLGVRRDIPELLALSDLFIFPSVSEGLPLVLLEAMAAGKPCVAFRLGPMPEVIADGVTGLLTEPGSAQALAQAIATLVQDPARCEALGQAGRARVHEHFHADEAARRLGELYGQVHSQHRTR